MFIATLWRTDFEKYLFDWEKLELLIRQLSFLAKSTFIQLNQDAQTGKRTSYTQFDIMEDNIVTLAKASKGPGAEETQDSMTQCVYFLFFEP